MGTHFNCYVLLRIITYYYKTILAYYCVIITSLFYIMIIPVTVFCYYVLLKGHYCILHFLLLTTIASLLRILHIHHDSLFQIHYYIIIISFLSRCFVIITSLLQMAKLCNTDFMVTCCYIRCFDYNCILPIITIITYYYVLVFETDRATCR